MPAAKPKLSNDWILKQRRLQMKADLHLHTTASDGRFSPADIVKMAIRDEVEIIAITDHDTVNGIQSALNAARSYPSLMVIPGVEINTDVPHGEVHILGFFIDYTQSWFQQRLEILRQSRLVRARRMLEKLSGLGMPLEWQHIEKLAAGGTVGRPHVALALTEKGYVSTVREAFDRYIGREGPAYVEREKIKPTEAVEIVVKAGGIPALAHPASIENLDQFLDQLQAVGLKALEAYYNNYSPEVIQRLVTLANKRGLIPCGGSDFHGLDSQSETPIGGISIPRKHIEKLLASSNKTTLRISE
jgi:predicted metal-dependent phosphoesterase TrpH